MRLTKLELHGFKSFADHTQLVFEPGVTAIVGPNGCGKSNVSDAVRWVLGEQRARMMRGAKMDEVIFQGSSSRRAVNVAEVSLHFANDEGLLPVPFKEVVITRRLSRSGDSDYFLNRAPCRLKDIADLLRGTGLGSDTGIVIESKMIDALLSDRADDRRELFEEAAGVGLYRDRRRTTERRLEETTGDLQRLDDLIGEVQSQVRSLARQRRRAERHAELTDRRFVVELTLARRSMAAWAEELTRLGARVAELREQLPAADEALLAAETAREAAHGARSAAEASRAELSRLVAAQRQEVSQLRSELAVAEERQRNTLARRERAEEERRQGEAYGVRLLADRDEATAARARLEQELQAAQEALAARQQSEEGARRVVAEARQGVDAAERASRELLDRARRAEIDRERATREADEVAQRAARVAEERDQLADALERARVELEEAGAEVDRLQAAAAGATEALEAARTEGARLRQEESLARAELARVNEAHTSLTGKVNALETLERERVGLAPAAARLLRDRARFGDGAVLGPLSDFIAADQASALLVERFLGATVHAIVVRDREVASAVGAWHAAEQPGPLLLLPVDALPVDALAAETDPPEGTERDAVLAALVQAGGAGRGWVRALLGSVRATDEGAAFVDARGAVWLPGSVAGPGPLRRRAEIVSLRAELESSEQAQAVAAERARELRGALDEAERRIAIAAEHMAVTGQQARRADERRGEATRGVQRAERELGEATGLLERLGSRREELSERLRGLEEELERLVDHRAASEETVVAARARMGEAERQQEEARELRTMLQVERAEVQARLGTARDLERRLVHECETAEQRLQTLVGELTGLADADSVLAEQIAEWRLALESRAGTLAEGEARLARAEADVGAADDALARAEQALDEMRRRGGTLADEAHQAELRLTELGGRREAIRERLETEWRRPLEEMLGAVVPLDLEDDALRREADELRQQLEQLGPVNALAIEEHEETLRRADFLTTQRADLAEARQSLLTAIREIDLTARELFLATFTQVRENFRQIFMSLFGGGECDLRLENPDAPLDCDIEIHASPRGKRTQRIHLLSSGERALVALSLLFGIFLTKPSPFCLLDEVDAPLDDANIGRFVRMLSQFKSRTQFIVITHNPRTTTEAADAVYGVTMQEPGVSSLVSVRMRGAPVETSESSERFEQGAREDEEVVSVSA